ncbi:MAG: contractile injection system tape measure protein, partial [Pseudomonadota bacterium]|nr:contractile injection system tape measure protein [Pseudomonadota bacterium]
TANDMTAHLISDLKQSQSRQKTGLSSQTSTEQFPDNPKPASVAPEQLSIRGTALYDEDGESVARGMEERDWPGDVGSQQGRDLIRGYDLDAGLRYILLHGSDHGEAVAGQLTIQIKTLATDYPALFLRLYREMQSGEIESEKLLTRLTTAALKEMVAATLAVTYPAGSDLSDFVQALELFAQRAVNENNYYGQVVDHLINDKLIDFEQLAETSGVTIEQGAMADVVPVEVGEAVVEPVLPDDGQQLTTEFVSYLVMSREVTAVNPIRFSMIVERLLTQQPQTFRQTLLTQLIHPFAGQQLALLLPERLLGRLLRLLHRATYESVLSCGEAITSACYNMQTSTRPSQLRQLMWKFIFQNLFVEGRLFREVNFIRAYVAYLAQQLGRSESRVFNAELLQMLALNIGSLPQQFYQTIVMALNSPVDVAAVHPSRLDKRNEIADSSDDQGSSSSVVEDIYIGNAGQVLAAPYLPRLFEMLGLMKNSKFKDQAAAERAAHLLQYLVDERCDAPEYQLVLNKILCGVKTGTPIVREITASDSERAAVNGLLQGMIQNWKAVGNTSAAGLRLSFLQREGRLQRNESGWHLLVQPRAYDMLLDQLPWSFSLIKQPWMERVLHVEWR